VFSLFDFDRSRMAESAAEKIYGADPSEPNTRLLKIKLIKAIDLQRRDFLGGSGDPYAKISLQTRDNRNQVVDIVRSRTVPKTLNPQWNQEFIFRVDSHHLNMTHVFITNLSRSIQANIAV
jgi:Ca2+-dependent lipid-binding protein